MSETLELIQSCLSSGESFEILVESGPKSHANMDSLPLRFGTHFDIDTIVTVENIISAERQVVEKKRQEIRHRLLGTVLINGESFPDTTIILGDEKRQGRPFLITIWRNDTETERGLSDLLVRLRKLNQVNPQILIELYPAYESGGLKTRDDLVVALRTYDQFSAGEIQSALHESLQANDLLQNQIIKWVDYAKQLERDKAMLEKEKASASLDSLVPTPSKASILVNVIENEMYKSSLCTVLVFSDGSRKQMKVGTFDSNHEVTQKAKSLVGRRVFTTCWDPKNEPGKWSQMGYFKNIYVTTELEELIGAE